MWYVNCLVALVMAFGCMCASVAWGSPAWVGSRAEMGVETSPLRTAQSTCVRRRMAVGFSTGGDRVRHPACCAMVWPRFQSLRVWSPRYKGQVMKWSQVSSLVWSQMHLVYPAGTGMERSVYHG